MRISDWSSDVCSSDLVDARRGDDLEIGLAVGGDDLVFVSGAQAHRFDLAVGLDTETRARDPAYRPQHRLVTGHDHRHALADLQRVRARKSTRLNSSH